MRTDVWGGYNALADREKVVAGRDGRSFKLGATRTCPAKRHRGQVQLTHHVLERHFRATRPEDVVGIHTTSLENLSRYGTAEVDHHGPESTSAEVNEKAALALYERARSLGLQPLLWDSNGKGGYHLDLLLR